VFTPPHVVMAFVEGPRILTAKFGRQPTQAELLEYVARERG